MLKPEASSINYRTLDHTHHQRTSTTAAIHCGGQSLIKPNKQVNYQDHGHKESYSGADMMRVVSPLPHDGTATSPFWSDPSLFDRVYLFVDLEGTCLGAKQVTEIGNTMVDTRLIAAADHPKLSAYILQAKSEHRIVSKFRRLTERSCTARWHATKPHVAQPYSNAFSTTGFIAARYTRSYIKNLIQGDAGFEKDAFLRWGLEEVFNRYAANLRLVDLQLWSPFTANISGRRRQSAADVMRALSIPFCTAGVDLRHCAQNDAFFETLKFFRVVTMTPEEFSRYIHGQNLEQIKLGVDERLLARNMAMDPTAETVDHRDKSTKGVQSSFTEAQLSKAPGVAPLVAFTSQSAISAWGTGPD
ncbi:hypothetical protein JX265_003146 [Neoarthrinium moseri]|uniref:Uncharacterized protein n=1 Tax=Neoarthrinium moseri TaxID=1658444 RepID=A0A9P9WTD0_9PEZI|nr:hypothetical protein JX265_003146 [Neoarthrinium moseri]